MTLQHILLVSNGGKPLWYHSFVEAALNPCFLSALLRSIIVRSQDVISYCPVFLQCGNLSVYISCNSTATLVLFIKEQHTCPSPFYQLMCSRWLSTTSSFITPSVLSLDSKTSQLFPLLTSSLSSLIIDHVTSRDLPSNVHLSALLSCTSLNSHASDPSADTCSLRSLLFNACQTIDADCIEVRQGEFTVVYKKLRFPCLIHDSFTLLSNSIDWWLCLVGMESNMVRELAAEMVCKLNKIGVISEQLNW
ncbi:hypothetical protein P9112_004603 [Eukaryota sp. TZLM1-RC]